jgi:hypothetical protein
MPKDNRDPIEVLKRELEFVEKGGYRKPSWRPQFVFEDSPACLNYRVQEHRSPCTDCVLIDLVPPERRGDKVPCRHIPLTDAGETVDYFYRCGTQQELEQALAEWLRKTIHRLEEQQRAKKDNPAP